MRRQTFDWAWKRVTPISCAIFAVVFTLSFFLPWYVAIPLALLTWLPAPTLIVVERRGWIREEEPDGA